MEIAGRVALVTGGAVRVGRAIALGLAREGADVIVHYNASEAPARELRTELRAMGVRAEIVGADLSEHDKVGRLADEAERAFGRVDILINNASVFPPAPFLDVDQDAWEQAISVNVRAPFFLTQRIGRAMRKRGEGVVINLADLAGIQPWAGYAAHGISKAGLIHLTRVAARALAPEVRVVGIAPGTVLPPDDFPPEEVEKLARRTALGRIGSPEDVVEAVLYLLRAPFVTGQTLILDGGRTLRD